MRHIAVRQPNGKLACFTTETMDFTHLNQTDEEVVAFFAGLFSQEQRAKYLPNDYAENLAKAEINRAFREYEPWACVNGKNFVCDDLPFMRWRACLDAMQNKQRVNVVIDLDGSAERAAHVKVEAEALRASITNNATRVKTAQEALAAAEAALKKLQGSCVHLNEKRDGSSPGGSFTIIYYRCDDCGRERSDD